jgi:hypothetical protein
MLIVTFDVLAYAATDKAMVPGARQPIPDGQKLYEALYARYHGRMIILGSGDTDPTMLNSWAKREGYKFALTDTVKGTGSTSFRDRVRDLNAVYGKIDWYVDTSPEAVTLVMQDGIPSLLVCLPNFVRPEWRDNKPKERQIWTDLAHELDVQSLYKNVGDNE